MFLNHNIDLVFDDIPQPFIEDRCSVYASAVHRKLHALGNCMSFIDGTAIGIDRPEGDQLLQRVAYNSHKRKHAIKFRDITSPCGLVLHLAGPIERRRHDWTLFVRSGIDRWMGTALNVHGIRYVIYGDSGYAQRFYLATPFMGSNLSSAEKEFNKAMSASRETVK